MWLISWRDLQWRRRRFVIAVAATGLVFAITLLLSGMSSGFNNEITRTVDAFHADAWVVPKGAPGPFTTGAAFPASAASLVRAEPGVRQADPMVLLRVTLNRASPLDLIVFGTVPGGIGPRATAGRDARRSGELVADTKLGSIGDVINVGGRTFRIVGTYSGVTVFGGVPTATISLPDARAISLAGQPLATSIVTRGRPSTVPVGFRVFTPSQAMTDLQRPLKSASSTINFLNLLLWVIAGGIIGSIVYLTVIERTRDFAVLKATGFGSVALFLSLALEAVIIALAAAVVASVIAVAIHGSLALSVEISTTTYFVLAGIAAVVGVLASLVGLRRAVGVDPALAFG
jgi:putative ABC transport system permease protein